MGANISHSIDRFATLTNRQNGLPFNSRWYCKGASGMPDTFTQHWGGTSDNWLHPPHKLIGATIEHLRCCKGVGTIIVPFDQGLSFWPMIAPHARGTVKDRAGKQLRVVLKKRKGLLLQKAVDPCREGRHHLLAVRLDFRNTADDAAVTPGLARRLRARLRRKD